MNTQQNSNVHVISPLPITDSNRVNLNNINELNGDDIKLPCWQQFCIGFVCMSFCCPCFSVYLCAQCCCKEKLEAVKISDNNDRRRRSSIIKAFPFLSMGTNPTVIPKSHDLHKNVYSNAPPQINFNQENLQNNHYRTGTADVLHNHAQVESNMIVNHEKKNQQKVLTIVEQENTRTQNEDVLVINHKESYKSKRSKSKAISRQKSLEKEPKDNSNRKDEESNEN